MQRNLLMVGGGVAMIVAIVTLIGAGGDPKIAGASIPPWITQALFASGGLMTFLLGFFGKKEPSPNPSPTDPTKLTLSDLFLQAMADGVLDAKDIPLVLAYLQGAGGGGLLLDPKNLPDQFQNAGIENFLTIFGQVLKLSADAEQVKGKKPKFIDAIVVYDATTFLPVVLGIDPRNPNAIRNPIPTPPANQPPVTTP